MQGIRVRSTSLMRSNSFLLRNNSTSPFKMHLKESYGPPLLRIFFILLLKHFDVVHIFTGTTTVYVWLLTLLQRHQCSCAKVYLQESNTPHWVSSHSISSSKLIFAFFKKCIQAVWRIGIDLDKTSVDVARSKNALQRSRDLYEELLMNSPCSV